MTRDEQPEIIDRFVGRDPADRTAHGNSSASAVVGSDTDSVEAGPTLASLTAVVSDWST